jgi:hypothetical protein
MKMARPEKYMKHVFLGAGMALLVPCLMHLDPSRDPSECSACQPAGPGRWGWSLWLVSHVLTVTLTRIPCPIGCATPL